MAIVFGASPSPFVRKVRVALAEKSIPYELRPVLPQDKDPEFRKMSPLGKIPAFKDGERALWFEEYADTAIVQATGPKVFLEKVLAPIFFNRPTDQATVDKAVAEDVPPVCEYLEGQLSGDYFVGNRFTIADIAVASPFVNYGHAGYAVDAARFPKLAAFVKRIHGRPSFQACLADERKLLGLSA